MLNSFLSGLGKAHWAVKAIIYVFCAILFLAFVTGINTQHFSPFTLSRDILSPVAIVGNDQVTVIIDDYEKDILFCDKDGRLFKIVDLSKPGSPAERAWKLQIIGDSVYVLATEQIDGGIFVKREIVLKYDLKGNYKGAVYHLDYPEGELHEKPKIRAMGGDGETLLLAVVVDRDISVIQVDTHEGKEPKQLRKVDIDKKIADIVFIPGTEDVLYSYENTGDGVGNYKDNKNGGAEISLSGGIEGFNLQTGESISNIEGYVKKSKELINKIGAEEYTFYDDDVLSLFVVAPIQNGTDKPPDSCYVINVTDKSVYRYDISSGKTEQIKSLPLHPWLFIRNLLFWIAVVVFGSIVILLIVRFIRNKWSSHTRTFLLMMLVLLIVTIFFSEREKNYIINQYKTNLLSTAQFVGDTITSRYSEWFSKHSAAHSGAQGDNLEGDDVEYTLKMVEDIDSIVKLVSRSQMQNSCYLQVFLIGPDKKVFFVSDSFGFAHFGNVSGNWNDVDDKLIDNVGKVMIEDALINRVYNTYRLIMGADGKPTGYIEVGNDLNNLTTALDEREINLTVELLALLITLFVLFRIISTFRGDISLYRKQKTAGSSGLGASLSGMYSFMLSVSIRLDSVILPLLAMRLCQGMEPDRAAMMAAMPVTAKAIGLWLGGLAFVPMTKWLGERRCAVLSQILCIAFCLAEAFCVSISNIYLFTAAKLVFSFFSSGIMYAFRRTIPLGTNDHELRDRAIRSDSQGSIAATVLSVLLGGYITQYINDVTLYIVGAVLSVPLLLLCRFIFPARNKDKSAAAVGRLSETAHRKRAVSVLLMPSILMLIVGIWVPTSLVNGYTGYLFPIFSKTVGMSAIVLSSFSVFAQTFNFASAKAVTEALKPYKRSKVTLMFILIPSLCLILSVMSRNIWWAIFCLFVCEFAHKQLIINFGIDVAENITEEYDAKASRHCVAIAQDGLDTATKPLLAAVVPVGYFGGSAILGGCCALLAGVRMIYERFKKKKNQDISPAVQGSKSNQVT